MADKANTDILDAEAYLSAILNRILEIEPDEIPEEIMQEAERLIDKYYVFIE